MGRLVMLALRAALVVIVSFGLCLAGASSHARPFEAPVIQAKYGLKNIPKKDRKRFWDMVEDVALLDVVIETCEKRRPYFDAQLKRRVKSCVEKASLRRVQAYFNKRRAHYSRVVTGYACKNQKFMESVKRFRSFVKEGVRDLGTACSLCFFC